MAAWHEPGAMPAGGTHNCSRVVQPWPPRLGLSVRQMRAPSYVRFKPSWVTRRMELPGGPAWGRSNEGLTLVGTPLTVADTEAPPTRQLLYTLNCDSCVKGPNCELLLSLPRNGIIIGGNKTKSHDVNAIRMA